MTEFKKVFFDTSPFIYCLEDNKEYHETVNQYITELYTNGKQLCTSVITIEEYIVKPAKDKNVNLIKNFYTLLDVLEFSIINIDAQIADMAAHIRANHRGFKGMDALQLAAFEISKSDVFLTNDKQLSQYDTNRIILVDDLMK